MKKLKRLIKHIINNFGYDLVRTNVGNDYLTDIKTFLPNDQPIIFDVGANRGQSVKIFREEWPKSIIHSFEPSPSIFKELKQKVSKFEDVYLWNCGLGSSSKQMNLLENSRATMSSFLPLGKLAKKVVTTKETLVEVRTIDQFCYDENIKQIDLLKSDTQGFDLEVFKGAEQTIKSNKIGLIYVEINFAELYENLPSPTEIYDFLISHNFSLVSFYKFYYLNHLAGWTDALFVHNSYIPINMRDNT